MTSTVKGIEARLLEIILSPHATPWHRSYCASNDPTAHYVLQIYTMLLLHVSACTNGVKSAPAQAFSPKKRVSSECPRNCGGSFPSERQTSVSFSSAPYPISYQPLRFLADWNISGAMRKSGPDNSHTDSHANVHNELFADRDRHRKVITRINTFRSIICVVGFEGEPKDDEALCQAKLQKALLPVPDLLEKKVNRLFTQRKLSLMRPDRPCTLDVALLDDLLTLEAAYVFSPKSLSQKEVS